MKNILEICWKIIYNMTDEKRKNKGEKTNESKNGWKPCGCTHTHTSLLNKKINKVDI